MRTLAGTQVPDDILSVISMQRLPNQIPTVLAASQTDSLYDLAELWYKVAEI